MVTRARDPGQSERIYVKAEICRSTIQSSAGSSKPCSASSVSRADITNYVVYEVILIA
jgi:hypothetical protein